MGDPFTVVTGAASFVSLGIQVCGGLIDYCRAWKSHDKEIEEALEKLTELELSLKIISEHLSVVESLDDSLSIQGARQKIYSCTAAMNRLHWTLIETESISQPTGILDKLHNIRLRSTFLFNRDKLQGLQSSIAESQSTLGNAIQILSLHLLFKRNVSIEKVVMNSNDRVIELRDSIEDTVIKCFDTYGHHLNVLQQENINASSEHTHNIQQVRSEISALQLGVISRPSLLRSAYQEDQRMQSQDTNLQRRNRPRCICRSSSIYKTLYDSGSYRYGKEEVSPRWNAATFTSNFVHRRNCPLSEEAEEVTQRGIRISFTGWLLQGAIQAAISMTRGSGGFSISPVLAFIPTVASDSAAFKVFDISLKDDATATDMQEIFSFSKQKLLRLFQDGKASPRDVDKDGNTILHKACDVWEQICVNKYIPMDSNIIEVYFQFLRDIHEMRVPLNNVNKQGLTPIGELFWYPMFFTSITPVEEEPVILLNSKMLDLGAEYPLFTKEMMDDGPFSTAAFGKFCSRNPDILEAAESNVISQSISARSWPHLVEAVRHNPDSIDQPNLLGQTPLHLSIGWPEAIRLLLDAGAAIDTIDIEGFTPVFYAAEQACLQSIQILGEAGCVLYTESDASLLYFLTRFEHYVWSRDLTAQDEAVFDCVVRLVAERRQELTALARNVLDGKDFARLHSSAQSVLDSKAPLAISMLQGKIDVPESLVRLSPTQYCVYHIPCLRPWQAQLLWNAGFRDINELDSFGRSPLMKGYPSIGIHESDPTRWEDDFWRNELIEWLLLKGADLHCRQGHAFQSRIRMNHRPVYLEDCKTDRNSATTALHYLAATWGAEFYNNMFLRWHGVDDGESSWSLKLTLQRILTDPLSDSCNCACSTKGCKAFTMMVKPAYRYLKLPSFRVRRIVRRITQSTAHLLDVNHPDFAWLCHEILRYNTFERLRLRHTCCILDRTDFPGSEKLFWGSYHEYFIAEFDDDERREIMEEQAEQVERLEVLLTEFEKKYEELDVPLMEFMDGYWEDRMKEISRERVPIDQAELERTGVILRRTSSCSSRSSCEGDDEDDDDDNNNHDDRQGVLI